jgi:hypothetical protein
VGRVVPAGGGGARNEKLQGRAKRYAAALVRTSVRGTADRENLEAESTARGEHGTEYVLPAGRRGEAQVNVEGGRPSRGNAGSPVPRTG